jgi:acyl dehydratase
MRLNELFPANEPVVIGSYRFDADRIIAFAREYDPHFFHMDAELAKNSLFGGLCASGWHVCAAAMKCNVAFLQARNARIGAEGGIPPKLGPSPSVRNLKWLKPVFADDTVTYSMRYTGEARIESEPHQRLCELSFEGVNQSGDKVLRFDCSVVEFG